MTAYVALLRAVNLSDSLLMADLRAIATGCGYDRVTTYIASGNLIFATPNDEATVKEALERNIAAHIGRPCPVMVRTSAEIAAVAATNPFVEHPGNRTVILFLDTTPDEAELVARHQTVERSVTIGREVFIAYGDDMGRSRFTMPVVKRGTGRNANTVRKLAEMSAALA